MSRTNKTRTKECLFLIRIIEQTSRSLFQCIISTDLFVILSYRTYIECTERSIAGEDKCAIARARYPDDKFRERIYSAAIKDPSFTPLLQLTDIRIPERGCAPCHAAPPTSSHKYGAKYDRVRAINRDFISQLPGPVARPQLRNTKLDLGFDSGEEEEGGNYEAGSQGRGSDCNDPIPYLTVGIIPTR